MKTRWLIVVGFLAVAGLAKEAAAQIPERFTNLRVLPDTISRDALIARMRGFSFALGVRCSYCHEVSDGLRGPNEDFASDARETKLRARVMLAMVDEINRRLGELPGRRQPEVAVECRTCHGGIARPQSLEDVLYQVTVDSGVAAARARYAELRERYDGGRAYDFGVRSRYQLGERLAEAGMAEPAIAVFRWILEEDSTRAEAWMNIGAVEAGRGSVAAAVSAYERAAALSPNGWASTARRRIAALRAGERHD